MKQIFLAILLFASVRAEPDYVIKPSISREIGRITATEAAELSTDQLHAKIARLEIEVTISALESGLLMARNSGRIAIGVLKIYGDDKDITPEQRANLNYNIRACIDAEMQISQEIARQKRKLEELPKP